MSPEQTSNSEHKQNARAEHGHDTETAPDQKPIKVSHAITVLLLIVGVMVVLGVIGILPREHAASALEDRTKELAAPSVITLAPKPGNPVEEVTLPGNVTSYSDSPIYARTSGYLTHWYYDIGAKVKQGALLAEIASPEVDQQLAQAEADLNTALANANNARIQADRYKGLVTDNAVSQQDTDTFVNQAASTSAQVKSAQANVQRLKELTSFEKVYAPFDGVITARRVDTGQLIDAGAGQTPSSELFHMQAVNTLRVYTNLPGVFSASVKRGETINLTFAEHPGQVFQGKLVRTADAIDPASRTLLVEVDVDNRKGNLLAGTLAEVHFKVNPVGNVFVLPVSVLIFRNEGLRVGTVTGDTAHLAPVTIGQDDGRTVQIITGLTAQDQVIQNPPDSLIDGEKVHVLTPQEMKAAEGAQKNGGI
ncbi:efflux RND transporter periplasmic adaptor subunit [Acidicapsa dinghuensis]|uniref:Efflux RND transporter periplasmic adaptor subunit n=1 Tax=Acidicapsa dinghuensis TaxID=2218256 RepID=A0ABW1EDQ3_9BACT|nr:efflux RND transporter periplasmic adaptor subunit [Acidicapsa dinghuensis]